MPIQDRRLLSGKDLALKQDFTDIESVA